MQDYRLDKLNIQSIVEDEMQVTVDQDTCIGSGNCQATCPEVFEVRDGKSHVKVGTVPEDLESKVREAVDGCPVQAISAT